MWKTTDRYIQQVSVGYFLKKLTGQITIRNLDYKIEFKIDNIKSLSDVTRGPIHVTLLCVISTHDHFNF